MAKSVKEDVASVGKICTWKGSWEEGGLGWQITVPEHVLAFCLLLLLLLLFVLYLTSMGQTRL